MWLEAVGGYLCALIVVTAIDFLTEVCSGHHQKEEPYKSIPLSEEEQAKLKEKIRHYVEKNRSEYREIL